MAKLIVLSLGSNVGDRGQNIKDAAAMLEKKFDTQLKKSPLYETPPLYYENQDDFYNCCVSFHSDLEASEIFKLTASIENKFERKRDIKHGPREIDIDIIFVGDMVFANEALTIPHPRMEDRRFVLAPLSDMYSEHVHPAIGSTVRELFNECPDRSEIKRIRGFWKE